VRFRRPMPRPPALALALALGLLLAALAAPAAAQVELYDARISEPVNPRGGVVPAERPIDVFVESSPPGERATVRVVYSSDGWTTTHAREASLVRSDAGPYGNNAEWRATIGPFSNARTVEYYVESAGPNGRNGYNGSGFNGPAGENFVLYSWSGPRTPAPARPGTIVEIPIAGLYSSQGWLHRDRGYYSPTEMYAGTPRIPVVYWVDWVPNPHWALANDGNHRTLDAVRQGLRTIQAIVVETPGYVWPARHRFLDQKVYADEDLRRGRPSSAEDLARRTPIGTAADLFGVAARGEGFGPPRRAAGPTEASPGLRAEAERVFRAVHEGARARVAARLEAAETAEVRARVSAGERAVRALSFEVVPSDEVRAERRGERVRISRGLLAELEARSAGQPAGERAAFRARVLGLVLAHEAAHASGLRSERLADAEGLRILAASGLGRPGSAALRAAVHAFARPLGAEHADGLLARLRAFLRYGSPAGRILRLEAAARGDVVDPYADYRRADGTLDWKRLGRDRARREGGALLHFTLALFLKEVAVVLKTGDRLRIAEFFDGLLTTDFYVHYGMFVLGARGGEVAFANTLGPLIKRRFVRELVRTNVVLAAGLALSHAGAWNGRTYVLSLTALGLSSTAVKGGVSALGWVHRVSGAPGRGLLARFGATRLARLGGWVYTAVELAVVLCAAEAIERWAGAWLDRRAARRAVAASAERFLADVAAAPDAAAVAAAAERHAGAWGDYRTYLYRPLLEEEVLLARRIDGVARWAKRLDDRRAAALDELAERPAIAASLRRRYGSLAGYVTATTAAEEAEVARDLDAVLTTYSAARREHLRAIYHEGRRGRPYLEGVGDVAPLFTPDSGDRLARLRRGRLQGELRAALRAPSANRLETYADEAEVVARARRLLAERGRADLAEALDAADARRAEARGVEADLARGDGFGALAGIGASLEDVSAAATGRALRPPRSR